MKALKAYYPNLYRLRFVVDQQQVAQSESLSTEEIAAVATALIEMLPDDLETNKAQNWKRSEMTSSPTRSIRR